MAGPFGVAIIGAGLFVKEEHLPAVLASPSLSLKAIYSRSLASAQSAASLVPNDVPAPDLYASDAGPGKTYADLLARKGIHAVIVAVPIAQLEEHVTAALKAGKHVLSEKPLAQDTAAARRMIEQYNATLEWARPGTPWWGVAENYRYLDAHVYARQEIAKLGRVTGFCTRFAHYMAKDSKWYQTSWRTVPSHQGGFLLDVGVHPMATIRFLLDAANDRVQTISALGTQVQDHLPPMDTLSISMKTASGTVGTFAFSVGQMFAACQVDVCCERGGVVVAGGVSDGMSVSVTKPDGGDSGKMSTVTKEFGVGFGVREEVRAWGEGLQRGRLDDRQDPNQALADLELLEMALKSAEQDGVAQTLQHQNLAQLSV